MCRFYRSIGFIIVVLLSTVVLYSGMEDTSAYAGPPSVVIEDNEIDQNSLVGIRIRGSTPVAINRCKIHSNGMGGIAPQREAQVTVTGCDITRNGDGGINIGEAAPTSAEDQIAQSEEGGRATRVQVIRNRIHNNDEGGIRSMPRPESGVDLSVVGNEIYKNKKGGVRIENDTKLTAKGNNIYQNGTLGIVALESVIPPEMDIYQNNVSFNGGAGIHIITGITGDIGIRNNWVYNNHRSGIACGLVGDPTSRELKVDIINNTIVSNGSDGQGAGIRNDSDGDVVILNNVVAFNNVSGIMTKVCGGYAHNLLFANGYVGTVGVARVADEIETQVNLSETLQYAGCMKKGKKDLIEDPLFVDPDNYNFDLRAESPGIDAGQDAAAYDDITFPPSKGTKRNDMGATGGPYAIQK
jgi:hypothetical protein